MSACTGFKYIGQPWASCDGCGRPAWEHEGVECLAEGEGPFGGRWEIRPWVGEMLQRRQEYLAQRDDAPSDQFDPRHYTWHFVHYYKYRFSFACDQEPQWRTSYGGDRDQIYRYEIDGDPGYSWDEMTEGTCTSDEDVAEAQAGNHEFVRIWQAKPSVPNTEGE